MNALFYAAAGLAALAGLLVVTRRSYMHALVDLVVLFLAVAVMLATLGAPFAAALQVIVYAGAIMVVFVFTVMLLNLGPVQDLRERQLLSGLFWVAPLCLVLVLLGLAFYLLIHPLGLPPDTPRQAVTPHEVGLGLFAEHPLAVEMASLLLLAALAAALHFGLGLQRWQQARPPHPEPDDGDRTAR